MPVPRSKVAWALSYLSTLSRAEIKINGAVSRLPICLLGVCRDSFTLTLTLLSYLTLKKYGVSVWIGLMWRRIWGSVAGCFEDGNEPSTSTVRCLDFKCVCIFNFLRVCYESCPSKFWTQVFHIRYVS